MSRAHRLVAALVPPPRDEWVRAHAAELDAIEGRLERLRWHVGLVRVAGWALAAQLIRAPRSFAGGLLARVVLGGLSLVNVATGLALAAMFALGTDAWQLLALGSALVAQGGYGLAQLGGAFERRARLAGRLQLATSVLAATLGALVLLAAIAANARASTTDPEYGPMTVALLATLHGVASLVAFTGERRRPAPGRDG